MRFLLALLIVLAVAPASASASSAMETGLADDDILLKSPSVAPGYVADWAAAGVDDVRVHVGWREASPSPNAVLPPRNFHPSDPADYDFAGVDRAVSLLRANGI